MHTDIQFSQHHLLKKLSSLSVLSILVEDQLTRCTWIYFLALYSVPVVCIPIFMSVPYYMNYCGYIIFFQFVFNWRIIALHHCLHFCYTKHDSAISIHMSPCSGTSSPFSTPVHPSRSPQRTTVSSLYFQQVPISYLFYIWKYVCFNATFSMCPTLSFPWCVQNLFSMSNVYSCLANKFISTIFLDSRYISIYIYALIYDTCFSDLLHSV